MRFLADENIYHLTIQFLRENNHSVLSIIEMGLSGSPDDKVFDTACQEKCILLTLDKDFTDLRRYRPENHSGIVVIRIKPPTTEKIEAALRQLLSEQDIHSKIKSALVVLGENGYRIRNLPLG